MAQPLWRFVAVDANGTLLGEIPMAANRQIEWNLNGPTVASFTIPFTANEARFLAPGSSYLKAYRTSPVTALQALKFYGPVWSVEEQAGGTGNGVVSIMVTAADPMAYLSKRFTVAVYSAIDQGAIVKGIIDTSNTADETGIRTTALSIPATTTRTIDWSGSKVALLDVIQQYGEMFDGVDTWVTPIELTASKTCDLNVSGSRGSNQADAIFGYGNGTVANCSAITRVRSMEDVANDVLGYAENLTSNWINTTSINTYRRQYADINFADETDSGRMSARTKGYLDNHSDPSQVASYSITTTTAAPRIFDSWDIGDTVQVWVSKGNVSYNATLRVVSAGVAISDGGVETISKLDVRPV